VNRSQGGSSLKDLYERFLSDYTYFDDSNQKILIIQSGIVDCAPRPIPDWLRFIVSKIPSILRKPIIQKIHDHRADLLRKGFRWRTTSPRDFYKIYENWLRFAMNRFTQVYVFSILPTNEQTEAHSPGYGKSVTVYNSLIQRAIQRVGSKNIHFLDVHQELDGNLDRMGTILNPKDGHHITPAGHDLFLTALIKQVSAEC
jgi:hypothetical protein